MAEVRERSPDRRLTDAFGHEALAEGLFASASRGVSLVSGLQSTGAVDDAQLERILVGDGTFDDEPLAPVMSLVERLPPGLCERLLALPVSRDAASGEVAVAFADGDDMHGADEIAYWLQAPVRCFRAPLPAVNAAVRAIRATFVTRYPRPARARPSGPPAAPTLAAGAPPARSAAAPAASAAAPAPSDAPPAPRPASFAPPPVPAPRPGPPMPSGRVPGATGGGVRPTFEIDPPLGQEPFDEAAPSAAPTARGPFTPDPFGDEPAAPTRRGR